MQFLFSCSWITSGIIKQLKNRITSNPNYRFFNWQDWQWSISFFFFYALKHAARHSTYNYKLFRQLFSAQTIKYPLSINLRLPLRTHRQRDPLEYKIHKSSRLNHPDHTITSSDITSAVLVFHKFPSEKLYQRGRRREKKKMKQKNVYSTLPLLFLLSLSLWRLELKNTNI